MESKWNYTVNGGTAIRDYRGKSIHPKPVENVPHGSTAYEMDTQKVYMFDRYTKTWILQ